MAKPARFPSGCEARLGQPEVPEIPGKIQKETYSCGSGETSRTMTTIFGDSYAGSEARHEALLYTSADEFASLTASFVVEALENDESAAVITSAENLEAFRAALNDRSPLVFLADGDDWYRNPAETVGRWVGFVEGQVAKGRSRVRGVGEIVPLRRGDAVEQWLHYESILNTLLTPLPLWVLCAYNTELLPDSIIEDIRTSHPTVIERGSVSPSDTYLPPGGTPVRPLALDGSRRLSHRPVDVVTTCADVEVEARRAGIAERQVQQLLAAVSEVARNAFVHGGAPVFVTAWGEHESFVCQIEDDGAGIADLVAGYAPPTNGSDGWGLWLARQRTHSLEVGRGPYGSAVRLTMRHSPGEAPRGLATRL
jgi:anti-sigma regulatory factor (Ser/Thr protein kinase)